MEELLKACLPSCLQNKLNESSSSDSTLYPGILAAVLGLPITRNYLCLCVLHLGQPKVSSTVFCFLAAVCFATWKRCKAKCFMSLLARNSAKAINVLWSKCWSWLTQTLHVPKSLIYKVWTDQQIIHEFHALSTQSLFVLPQGTIA